MNFLFRFYLYSAVKAQNKIQLNISSGAIDFFTLYKQSGSTLEGTRLQTNIIIKKDDRTEYLSHIVDCVPELCNKMGFDGLFIKSTVQYVGGDGAMKKYTSYLNPNNICCLYSLQPDCTECFFYSGQRVLLANKHKAIMDALKQHNADYKKRRSEKYAKKKSDETGF